MRRINSLLEEYGDSHQNRANKTIHWICVPLIFFSVVGFFWSIPLGPLSTLGISWINWATVALALVTIYYISLSPQLALGMILFATLCIVIWLSISPFFTVWQVALAIFILAWIGQFYGHKVEGKKPSFFKDLQFLLIGPAWLMHFIYKKVGIQF